MLKQYIHAIIWAKRHLFGQLTVPEIKYIARFIAPTDICIDIGAHAGSWLFPLGRAAFKGQVYGFEGLPYYANVLRITARLIGPQNVVVVPSAVTQTSGSVALVVEDSNGVALTGRTHLASPTEIDFQHQQKTAAISLDDYFARETRRISFIKCDVEGGELGVFRGAANLLKQHRPVIYTELVPAYLARYGASTHDIFELFRQLNYKSFSLVDSSIRERDIRDSGDLNDLLLIPAELTPQAR
jgi:FkbM family methyltransferase